MMSQGDRRFVAATGAATALLGLALGAILFALLAFGAPAVGTLTFGAGADIQATRKSLLHATYGTALCTLLMTVAVVPVGVITAVHLTEYARPGSRFVGLIRAAVRALAGVPSIVFGLFGLGFFVLFVGRGIDAVAYSHRAMPLFGRPSVMWASATLAVLTLPVVIVTTEDALRSVPRELREAAHALGATKLQGIYTIIIPAARTGILTGAILATSRGAGEVAAILFTGVAGYTPNLPTRPHDGFMHLGYQAYVLATQSPDVDATTPTLFLTALILVMATLGLNGVALVLRDRARSRV